MDSRLGLEKGHYTMDSLGHPPYNHPHPSALSAPSSHLSLSTYLDRDIGRQDFLGHQQGGQYAPPPTFSLSTGQGYYTVESLDAGAVTPGDVGGARPPVHRQDGNRHLILGQQGFDSGILVPGMQNGSGQKVPPHFGVADPVHHANPHLSQELDLGRRRAMGHMESSVGSYPRHEQSGLLPGGSAYDHPVQLPSHPSFGSGFAGPQEVELKRRDELPLTAVEQRRDIEHEARFWEARMQEARMHEGQIREAQIREAQIREAQTREARIREARIREARRAFIQERSLDRRGRLPVPRRHPGLSSGPTPASQGGNKTWCSVCKLECNTSINLKGHLGGKRHKLKLEEGLKKSEKSVEEKDDSVVEGAKISASETPKIEVNESDKIQPAGTDGKVKLDHLLNGSNEGEVPSTQASELPTLGKRSLADDTDTLQTPSKKTKQESIEAVSNSVGESGRASGNLPASKKGAGKSILRCTTCNVICFSKFDLDVHLGGKKHAFNLKQLPREVGGEGRKASHAGAKPKEVAVVEDGSKEEAKNEVCLSVLCAQAESIGRTIG